MVPFYCAPYGLSPCGPGHTAMRGGERAVRTHAPFLIGTPEEPKRRFLIRLDLCTEAGIESSAVVEQGLLFWEQVLIDHRAKKKGHSGLYLSRAIPVPGEAVDTRAIHMVYSLWLCAVPEGERARTMALDRRHPNRTGSVGER